MKDIGTKREREKKMISRMIALYCHRNHHTKGVLCPECAALNDYARARSEHCPFMETKTFCVNCRVHCYKPDMREKIRAVMRFCGALGVAARPGVVNDQELFRFANSSTHWASALFASSTWLPWMARPFVTAAPWAALRMSFSVSERPLPSCVQKGWMVLPVKS